MSKPAPPPGAAPECPFFARVLLLLALTLKSLVLVGIPPSQNGEQLPWVIEFLAFPLGSVDVRDFSSQPEPRVFGREVLSVLEVPENYFYF